MAFDRREIVLRLLNLLAVRCRFARADVQHDLVDSWRLKRVLVAELLHEFGPDNFVVALLETRDITGIAFRLADGNLGSRRLVGSLFRGLLLGLLGFARIALGCLGGLFFSCLRHR